MDKVRSGVYGLNSLLGGGLNKNSATTIVGATGTGKTTFATQFLHRGLEEGEEAIYITLEEPKEQILREAAEMGWSDLYTFEEEGLLVFIEAGGKEFSEFIKSELLDFVQDWKGIHARIIIDPLTPIIWTAENNYVQRELISTLFNESKKVGTVVATLEEHGTFGNLSGPETVIPMYLSDTVLHLRYLTKVINPPPEAGLKDIEMTKVDTVMRIVKARSSWHSTVSHPYSIFRGIGLVIEGVEFGMETDPFPEDLKATLEKKISKLPPKTQAKLARMIKSLSEQNMGGTNPHQLFSLILQEYDIQLG